MSKQSDYTPEEWKTISAAPVMAGLLITVSDFSDPSLAERGVFKDPEAIFLLRADVRGYRAVQIRVPLCVLIDKLV